jgi:acetyl esterase/lipase
MKPSQLFASSILPLLAFSIALSLEAAALAQPKPPEFKIPDSVVLEADLEYGRAGDRSLKLDLLRPRDQGEKVLPVIAHIHGGGWQAGNKETGRRMCALLAATGDFVCVTIDYRLTNEAIWPAQIHDCKAAIRWLRASADKYHLDPKRIAVTGNSAGGHLASLLGTSGDVAELEGSGGSPGYSSRVQCVADFCGPSDFMHFLDEKGAGGRSAVIKLLGGLPSEHPEVAKAASPVTYVSADDPPFLVAHGAEDGVVPLAQAETLVAALQKAKVPVTFILIEGAGHTIGGRELFERARTFYSINILGKAAQLSDAPIRMEPPQSAAPKK